MACENVCAQLLNNMLYDCNNKSVGGIEQTVKLINRCDIELSDWLVNRNNTDVACNHQLSYTGTDPETLNALIVQGIPGKRLLNATFSSSNTDYGVYYTHGLNLFAQGLSKEVLCNIKALGDGADVVAIVKQNFKGNQGLDSFLVYGWDTGLKLGDMTHDTNENNGNSIIPLSSLDPDLEPYPPMILLMTDYETTEAFFNSLGTLPAAPPVTP